MMIQPTVEMAEDFSKSRISPMIRDTPSLSKLFFDVKSKSSNNTILSKIFPGGRLIMCGANSPAGLASRPIRILNYKITRPHRGGIPLSLLGVDGGKQEIMNCLAVSEPGPRYFHFPLDEPELGLDGRGYDDVYFKGIISEHKSTVAVT